LGLTVGTKGRPLVGSTQPSTSPSTLSALHSQQASNTKKKAISLLYWERTRGWAGSRQTVFGAPLFATTSSSGPDVDPHPCGPQPPKIQSPLHDRCQHQIETGSRILSMVPGVERSSASSVGAYPPPHRYHFSTPNPGVDESSLRRLVGTPNRQYIRFGPSHF
jgi:hypothetical protein